MKELSTTETGQQSILPSLKTIVQTLVLLSYVSTVVFITYILSESPATGYEVSVYWQYPIQTWFALGIGFTGGLCIVILSAFIGSCRRYWYHGFVIIFLIFVVYLFLPVFRGYFLYASYNSDILIHLEFTRYISRTGSFHPEDWYPVVHILFYILEAFGVSRGVTTSLVAYIFFVINILGMYTLGRTFGGERVATLFGALATIPYAMGYIRTLHPFHLSFMMVPLVYMNYRRYWHSKNKKWLYCTMILSFLIVFFHPISTLFLILILLSPALTDAVLERRGVSTPVRSTYVTVFIAVGIVAWMITFERITRAVGSIAAFYLYGSTASIAENQFSAASSGLTTQQTLNRFIELYGSILFLGLASGLCLMIVLYRFMSDKESLRDATAATHFILGCLVGVIMVFGFFLAKDPVRVSRYMVFGGILLSGTVLSSFHSKQNSRLNINYLLLIVLVLVLLVTSIPLALMGVYNPNYHLAESEYEGTGWVVNHHEDGKGVMSYRTDRKLVTYADTDTVRGGGLYPFRTKESPKRLGYGDNETINETLTSETPYLATKNRDTEFYRAYYRNQWPRTIEYTDDDIHRLRNDRGAKKLYTNGGFQLWRGQ